MSPAPATRPPAGSGRGDGGRESPGGERLPSDYLDHIEQSRIRSLSITAEHADAAGSLPRHHDDPFDRMLVAQARLEGLTLVTADRRLGDYGVAVLAAG